MMTLYHITGPSSTTAFLSTFEVNVCIDHVGCFFYIFYIYVGTLMDMKKVRLATQAELGAERPAILRKDFILDRFVIHCLVLLLYCTVLHCTALYCAVLCCTILYYTTLYCIVPYRTVLGSNST